MNRILYIFALPLTLAACGGSKKPAATEGDTTSTSSDADKDKKDDTKDTSSSDSDKDKDKEKDKKDVCMGFEVENVEDLLIKSACEVPMPTGTPPDVKGKLEVKVVPNPMRVAPGGHVDLLVSFTNKTKDPMQLSFQIDPMPRFEVEAYDAKGNRVDLPKGSPPPLKAGVAPRGPGEAKAARITLTPNGTAKYKIGWDASKMRWAPEKVAGSAPERGYPRVPSGPLPKGKYYVKVVTPLIGVFEGSEKEISAPRVEIAVEK